MDPRENRSVKEIVKTMSCADEAEQVLPHSTGRFTGEIWCLTQSITVGNQYNAVFTLAAGEHLNLVDYDIRNLWVKNAAAASTGTLQLIGVIKRVI